MPLVATGRFGQLVYDASEAIEFPVGLPGFEQHHRFVLVEQPELAPLVFLQSLESPDLSLPAVPVAAVDHQYALDLTPEDQELLGLEASQQPFPPPEVRCLAILTAPQDGQSTANLLAPVVINLSTRVGVQAVRSDARYSHRHRLGAPCS
jgi:flagellar assembly factor FliW